MAKHPLLKHLPYIFFILLLVVGIFAAKYGVNLDFAKATDGATAPVLVWKLDDVNTVSALDSSGNTNDGTLSGPIWRTDDYCFATACLFFDGTDDLVSRTYSSDTELNPGTAAFTVSTLFRHPNAISGQDTLIARFTGAGYKVYMNSSGFMCFGIDDDSTWDTADLACSTTGFNDSKWHFLQAVRNTSDIRLYIDGIEVGSDTSLTETGSLSGSSPTLYYGIDSTGNSNAWSGFADEFKIHMYARSAAQRGTDAQAFGSVYGVNTNVAGSPAVSKLSSGIVMYLAMDEMAANSCTGGTNDNCDVSGNVNDGAYGGNAAGTSTAKFNRSTTFDGTNDNVTVADSASLSPTSQVSMTAWVLPNSSIATRAIIVKDTSYRMVTDASGNPQCQVHNGTAWQTAATSSVALTTGVWYHVACSYNGAQMQVLVNRQVRGTSDYAVAISDNANSLVIGEDGGGTFSDYNGQIDDVHIYNVGVPSNQISALSAWGPAPANWYKLDENTGTSAFDYTGTTLTGTLTSGPLWAIGRIGSSVLFDGSDDNIIVADNVYYDVNSNGYSIMAWVYRNAVTNDGAIVCKKSDAVTAADAGICLYQFSATNDAVTCMYYSDGTDQYEMCTDTNSTATLNTWQHVAAVIDRTSATISNMYLDGIPIKNPSFDIGTPTNVDSTANAISFQIGANSATRFNGRIDDVKIYKYPRTKAQIIEDMNSNRPAAASTPIGSSVAYWKFDEGYGTSANSSGSQGSTVIGTLTNMASPATSTSGWTSTGRLDKALIFDGADDIVNAGSASFLDDMPAATFTAWIYPTGWGESSFGRIVAKENTGTATALTLINDSSQASIRIYRERATTIAQATAANNSISLNTWQHVTGMYDTNGTVIKLFVNGREVSSYADQSIGSGAINTDASLNFNIGNRTAGDRTFAGTIDDVRVFNGLLTDEQVRLLYNQGVTTKYGSLSTESDGITTTDSQARENCLPGDTSTCNVPIAHWKFDENTGTSANDSTGLANTGTLTSGPVWVQGKIGQAVRYDGTDDYTAVGDLTSTESQTDLSWSMWVRPTVVATTRCLFCKFNNANTQTAWAIETGTTNASAIRVRIPTGASDGSTFGETATGMIAADTWTHVEVVYNGALTGNSERLKVYVNGVSRTLTFTGTIPASTTATTSVGRFGASSDGARFFNGAIDNVIIYDYARTVGQVGWDYNRGGPIGWWKFDECTGATANDASGFVQNGTITPGDASGNNDTVGTCSSGDTTQMWHDGTTGKFNSSLDFDGTNDYVDMDDPSAGGLDFVDDSDFSLSFWINRDTESTNDVILAKKNSSGSGDVGYLMFLESSLDTLFFYTSDGSAGYNMFSSTPITSTGWNHFVIVFDQDSSANSTIYLNGKLETVTTQGTITNVGTLANSVDFRVGIDSDGGDPFDGRIDDVRVYNYTLTQHQVRTIYNDNAAARFGPSEGRP